MGTCSVDPTHPVVAPAGGPDYWDPKGTRERLCKQAMYVNVTDHVTLNAISHLISILDLHRPLRSDGKHANLHTPTCGCDYSGFGED